MATYAISFQIKYDSGDNWGERYNSLMAAINSCSKVWSETTSFCLVQTNETLTELERRLWLTKFDATQDILFVVDVSYDSCTIRGATKKRATLKELMPALQEK